MRNHCLGAVHCVHRQRQHFVGSRCCLMDKLLVNTPRQRIFFVVNLPLNNGCFCKRNLFRIESLKAKRTKLFIIRCRLVTSVNQIAFPTTAKIPFFYFRQMVVWKVAKPKSPHILLRHMRRDGVLHVKKIHLRHRPNGRQILQPRRRVILRIVFKETSQKGHALGCCQRPVTSAALLIIKFLFGEHDVLIPKILRLTDPKIFLRW